MSIISMKQLGASLALLILVGITAEAQISSSTARRVRGGTTLPATCRSTNPVDVFVDTDATSTARWYVCTSTNTWTAQGAAAGIGGSTGATDNAILRADGTGGATLQNSSPTINDNGAITVPNGTAAAPSYTFVGDGGGTGFSRPFADQIEVSLSTSRAYTFNGSGLFQSYGVNAGYGFGATAGSLDTGLSRVAAGVVEVNNGTAGQSGVLLLRGRTFANLPASPVAGMMTTVTDSNTSTWGATIAGGGANVVLAYYNGTNWTVAAK